MGELGLGAGGFCKLLRGLGWGGGHRPKIVVTEAADPGDGEFWDGGFRGLKSGFLGRIEAKRSQPGAGIWVLLAFAENMSAHLASDAICLMHEDDS